MEHCRAHRSPGTTVGGSPWADKPILERRSQELLAVLLSVWPPGGSRAFEISQHAQASRSPSLPDTPPSSGIRIPWVCSRHQALFCLFMYFYCYQSGRES